MIKRETIRQIVDELSKEITRRILILEDLGNEEDLVELANDILRDSGAQTQPERVAFTDASVSEVDPYLPGNYSCEVSVDRGTRIYGYDRAGWTMDAYVIPRLASGCIFAKEGN